MNSFDSRFANGFRKRIAHSFVHPVWIFSSKKSSRPPPLLFNRSHQRLFYPLLSTPVVESSSKVAHQHGLLIDQYLSGNTPKSSTDISSSFFSSWPFFLLVLLVFSLCVLWRNRQALSHRFRERQKRSVLKYSVWSIDCFFFQWIGAEKPSWTRRETSSARNRCGEKERDHRSRRSDASRKQSKPKNKKVSFSTFSID